MMLAVASIVQRFQLRAVPNATATPLAATTLRPGEGGVPVSARARSSRLPATSVNHAHSGEHRAFVAA